MFVLIQLAIKSMHANHKRWPFLNRANEYISRSGRNSSWLYKYLDTTVIGRSSGQGRDIRESRFLFHQSPFSLQFARSWNYIFLKKNVITSACVFKQIFKTIFHRK